MERVRKKKEKKKENVEMFSSGCNLSLSRRQHSRVILQHSPVRRTEVALCLGLTQAHIHLKTCSLHNLQPLLPIHAADELHICHRVFLADLVFTLDSEE